MTLRSYRDRKPPNTAFYKFFVPNDFYPILNHAAVLIGNSSSFIREAAFLGIPSVLVGNRQQGRERGDNCIEVKEEREAILKAIRTQMNNGRFKVDMRFGDGTASKKIVSVLTGSRLESLSLQKKFYAQ